VVIGIETDRGPWVTALVAAGYRVYAINPMSVARYRERHSTSGAKSDAGDAWLLADLVRTDAARHRPVAGDSPAAEGIKVLARAHLRLIWERNRSVLRLRSTLREYFPAALEAFPGLAAAGVLELLGRAADPAAAARLSSAQVTAALKRARRCHAADKTAAICAALRAPQLAQPGELTAAYAATVVALTRIIAAFNEQIPALEAEAASSFHRHPVAGIYLSQPGLGPQLGARVLGEFGDDPHRYATAKGRKNYASTSPITRASGKKTLVMARYARNDWAADAIHRWAFCSLRASPGARAYYDGLRARGKGHNAALRQLGNRLVGILHGCLKTGTCYDEQTAWGHRPIQPPPEPHPLIPRPAARHRARTAPRNMAKDAATPRSLAGASAKARRLPGRAGPPAPLHRQPRHRGPVSRHDHLRMCAVNDLGDHRSGASFLGPGSPDIHAGWTQGRSRILAASPRAAFASPLRPSADSRTARLSSDAASLYRKIPERARASSRRMVTASSTAASASSRRPGPIGGC
jgi:hypothetical protein